MSGSRWARRTNIQENAVLHTDMGFPLTIGRDCTIGHKAMLHGCTIGDGTLIGMGATVLNGAKIGQGLSDRGLCVDHRGQGNSGRLAGDGIAGAGGAEFWTRRRGRGCWPRPPDTGPMRHDSGRGCVRAIAARDGRSAARKSRRGRRRPMNMAFGARSVTRHQSATVMPRVRSDSVSISTLMWRPENRPGSIR